MRRQRDSEAGFTLVELLVVLVILALLAALVGPRVVGYLGQSRVKTARIQLASYQTALELFHIDMGRYPRASEGLAALTAPPVGVTGWNGPYLTKSVQADPWGHDYRYAAQGDGAGYTLSSLGADGREGGEGDDADIFP